MMKTSWQKQIIKGIECIVPFDQESKELLSNFKQNQPLVGDLHGTNKERSVIQLNLYWKACEVFAELTAEGEELTKKKIDWWLRNLLKFYDTEYTYVLPCGTVTFKCMSISFENLKHILACDYFDRAFFEMADHLKLTVEEFISVVKSKMKRF